MCRVPFGEREGTWQVSQHHPQAPQAVPVPGRAENIVLEFGQSTAASSTVFRSPLLCIIRAGMAGVGGVGGCGKRGVRTSGHAP